MTAHEDWLRQTPRKYVMLDERERWLFSVIVGPSPFMVRNGSSDPVKLISDLSSQDAEFLLSLSREEAIGQVEHVYGPLNIS